MNKILAFLKPQNNNIKPNFIFAFWATLASFAPDLIMNLLADTHIMLEPLFVFYVFGFMFLLSFCQKFVVYLFLCLFILMQSVQLNFMAFFGHPITASEIMNIFYEKRDVFDTAYLQQTWFVMPSIILFYGLAIFAFYKGSKKCVKISWMFLVVFYLAAHKPYRAAEYFFVEPPKDNSEFYEVKNVWYFQPGPTRSSLKNSINTFSYFLFRYLWLDNSSSEVAYTPYSLQKVAAKDDNVLLIFGESLYSEHMPMFGYERNTFPLLSQRLQNAKDVAFAKLISPGISTATSTTLFFNTIREPGNIKEIRNLSGNLFKTAKENGFETYYYSNQESRLLMNLGEKYIDHIVTNDSEPLFFSQHRDEGLALLLDKIDFSKGKKFVVLHLRTPHLPYEKHYQAHKDKFQKFLPDTPDADRLTYMVNSYDNALLYNDFVVDEIINTFEKHNQNRKYVIFFTADHGQLFNYHGMWGHNKLIVEQGKVPAFIFNYKEKLPPTISAYQFSKLILQALGGKLINPNEKNNVFYLHGNNIYYPYDFMEYQILKDGNISSQPPMNTNNIQK